MSLPHSSITPDAGDDIVIIGLKFPLSIAEDNGAQR